MSRTTVYDQRGYAWQIFRVLFPGCYSGDCILQSQFIKYMLHWSQAVHNLLHCTCPVNIFRLRLEWQMPVGLVTDLPLLDNLCVSSLTFSQSSVNAFSVFSFLKPLTHIYLQLRLLSTAPNSLRTSNQGFCIPGD